jgi:hypothetical protein
MLLKKKKNPLNKLFQSRFSTTLALLLLLFDSSFLFILLLLLLLSFSQDLSKIRKIILSCDKRAIKLFVLKNFN